MKTKFALSFLFVSALVLNSPAHAWAENPPEEVKSGKILTAAMESTAPELPISGKATFEETEGGLKLQAELQGLPPGEHGFHIHEKGACGSQGMDAGDHFNPDAHQHGNVLDDGLEQAHAGDLGNIHVREDGRATYEKLIPGLSLVEGKYAVEGKALIVHAKKDNYTQPAGDSGARIACGVISA